MGGMLIAKAFLPSGAHIKQALSYLDLAIKSELVMVSKSCTKLYINLKFIHKNNTFKHRTTCRVHYFGSH